MGITTPSIIYDFDSARSERNLRERGFDFDFAAVVFDGDTIEFVDDREDYGEIRNIAFGLIDSLLYAVVYTKRGEARRGTVDHLGLEVQGQGVEAMEATRGRSLSEARVRGRVNRAMVEQTTEDDTRRHLIEDGFDPDNPLKGFREIIPVVALRKRVSLSQEKFAAALRIPVKTLRNWEQGRSRPDQVALSFFALVADDPARAFKVLSN